jgi:N-carbamoylputrescine amidase
MDRTPLKVAAIQMAMSKNQHDNIQTAIQAIETAAQAGAKLILLPELFLGYYFCQIENYDHFELAIDYEKNDIFPIFQALAKKLKVVIPLSYFEKDKNLFFNSLVMIDADGRLLGQYRKSHIPTGESYQEKFYFSPGDTGFKVFETSVGNIGIGICWDQWFPEVARILTLEGADILLYPTAIGSEPTLPHDSQAHWQTTMQGHAASNIIPVIAANRIGQEAYGNHAMTFYGSSFATDHRGQVLQQLTRDKAGILYAEYDLAAIRKDRYSWGVFRDRRPSLYGRLLKK